MKVNGIDISRYDAKQLTADVQPPSIFANYEWVTGAVLPMELESEVQMGHLKLTLYMKGKDRSSIIRSASELMANFKKACDLDVDGYAGKYRGFMTKNDYEKTIAKDRHIINVEFDGFFYDEEREIVFDETDSAVLNKVGTRETPCVIEVFAKSDLSNYIIRGFGDDEIVIASLAAGKKVVIDGINGLVTVDGENAFASVSLWEFPKITEGEMLLTFSSTRATVIIRYMPMWI